jgi:hypothetical protein
VPFANKQKGWGIGEGFGIILEKAKIIVVR